MQDNCECPATPVHGDATEACGLVINLVSPTPPRSCQSVACIAHTVSLLSPEDNSDVLFMGQGIMPHVGQHAQADPELIADLNADPIEDLPPAHPHVPGDAEQGLAETLAAALAGGGGGRFGAPAAQPFANQGQSQSQGQVVVLVVQQPNQPQQNLCQHATLPERISGPGARFPGRRYKRCPNYDQCGYFRYIGPVPPAGAAEDV